MARPSKMAYSEKQTIVNNYYILECESNPDKLKSRGVFSELASFAANNGYPNVRAYDFSRDEKLLAYIDTLYTSQTEKNQNITTAFKSFDIDYLFRKDISDAEKRKTLLDLETYYKNQLSTDKKRTEIYAKIQEENNAVKKENGDLKQQNSQLIAENKELKENIRDCERYIEANVLPEKAEEILDRKKSLKQIVENLTNEKPKTGVDYRATLHSNLVVLK